MTVYVLIDKLFDYVQVFDTDQKAIEYCRRAAKDIAKDRGLKTYESEKIAPKLSHLATYSRDGKVKLREEARPMKSVTEIKIDALHYELHAVNVQ